MAASTNINSDSMNPLYDIAVKKDSNQPDVKSSDLIFESESKVVHDTLHQDPVPCGKVEHQSSIGGNEVKVEYECPKVNCTEKIVICLDNSHEMEKATFQSRTGDTFAPKRLIKRALGIFLNSKHNIDKRHEFALVWLKEAAYWICDFTTNPEKIITFINSCTESFQSETCEFSSVFDAVQEHAPLPQVEDPELIPPPYIVRVIMIYGRSHCIPTHSNTESFKQLCTSPYFYVDAFYIHETLSEENNCEEIFDKLCELDEKGLSYIFEVSRNPTKLYDSMAQLLGHPLQRPIQKEVQYSIQLKEELSVT